VKDRLRPLALTAPPSRKRVEAVAWLEMREAVEYALERLQVKAVVIDEAQQLMHVTAPLRPVDQRDWLKTGSRSNGTKNVKVV